MARLSNSLKNNILFVILAASMVPFDTGESGLQANYIYLVVLVLPFVRFRMSPTVFVLLGFYTIVFLAGIIALLTNGSFYFLRTTASFVAFIIPLIFALVKMDDNFYQVFKRAVVFVSIAYSLLSVFQLLQVGYSGDFHMTKAQVGSQRYGFILILAFFLVMYDDDQARLKKLLFESILLVGILLTFSRASFVAFGLTAAFMILRNTRRIRVSYMINGVIFCVIMTVIFYDTVIGKIATFFTEYLLSFRNYDLTAKVTSEGYRLYVFKQILTYVLAHPLFGSNFAGLYLIYPEYETSGASAHGQYNDMLLRTGFLGLAMYVYVLYYLVKHYARTNKGLFYGLIGILIYGFFHETFKLGHASLIFGVLLGYYLTQREETKQLSATSA
jgi:hypothetical protein